MSEAALPAERCPRFSSAEYLRRYAAVRADMKAKGLEALIVWGTSIGNGEPNGAMNMASAYYLSNYSDLFFEYVLLPLEGQPILFVSPWSELSAVRQWSVIDDIRPLPLKGVAPVVDALLSIGLDKARIGIVGGIRGKMSLPIEHQAELKAAFLAAHFQDAHEILDRRRAIKSAEELDWLRRGCRLTDDCFLAISKHARPGLKDYELRSHIIDAVMREGGMLHIEFCAATPMAEPLLPFPLMHKSERVIKLGDVILTEISAGYYGYSGQQQRPFAVGMPPTDRYRRAFDFACEMFHEVCAALRPGVTSAQIWTIYDKMKANGFTNYGPLLHGWGMGMDVPVIGSHGGKRLLDFVFEEGMTVIVQPNPVFEGTDCGVFLGNMVQITTDGAKSMSGLPLKFVQI